MKAERARLSDEELDAADWLAANDRVDIPSDVRALIEVLTEECRERASEHVAVRSALRSTATALSDIANLNHFDGYDHAPSFETCDAPSCNEAQAALAVADAALDGTSP